VLRLIAAFKFSQALTLLAVALGAFRLLKPEVAELFQDWVDNLPIESERTAVQHFLGWATGLAPHQLLGIGVGALLYATLFLVEGVGLWRGKLWAEWLTVIATGLPIPLEIYEVVAHVSVLRVGALVLNVGIVWLLARNLRQKQVAHRARADAPLIPSSR